MSRTKQNPYPGRTFRETLHSACQPNIGTYQNNMKRLVATEDFRFSIFNVSILRLPVLFGGTDKMLTVPTFQNLQSLRLALPVCRHLSRSRLYLKIRLSSLPEPLFVADSVPLAPSCSRLRFTHHARSKAIPAHSSNKHAPCPMWV